MVEKLSLFELQEQIKRGIENQVKGVVWITAEIAEINHNSSGHCYLDLVDYSQNERGVAAKARGIIWASTFRLLRPYFESTTGATLKSGMNVLLKVQVQYSHIYGLSLIISDIDPSYTIGELELKRQQTIKRLKEEGCFDLNTQLSLPALPRKLAIISSVTAAGYRDFEKHLHQNEYGYIFSTKLFQAQMQGDLAPESIIAALDEILLQQDDFDVVILIRGGGSAMDLSCFDDYELALNISQFPLPIITGIGHDHDYHVCDMVANIWQKTPTAVADFIISIFNDEALQLDSLLRRLSYAVSIKIGEQSVNLANLNMRIKRSFENKLTEQLNLLSIYETKLKAADPTAILSRGFGVLYKDSEKVISVNSVQQDANYQLVLSDGVVEFKVGEIVERKLK